MSEGSADAPSATGARTPRPQPPTPFPQARALVLQNVYPLGTEWTKLSRLVGRVLAEDIVAPFDVPGFDNSQVDGYAYRVADKGPRRIVGESAAGGPPAPPVGMGEAVRIFTGAPIPQGANAVAMQEDCDAAEGLVTIQERGNFIRRQGEEIAAGTNFGLRGRIATPPLVGLIASFGPQGVETFRPPRVWIVATGNELVPPGRTLPLGGVYASNPHAIRAALELMGIPADILLVRDDPETMLDSLDRCLEAADVVITLGGVSVGDHDLVRPTLAALGVEEVLWRVAMKPGKPFYMGCRDDKTVFGLPGNPVSALVTFALLVRPALRRMLGLADAAEETTARLGAPFARKDLRYEFLRATLSGGVATPVSAQGSHMQTGLAFADALIHVPDGVSAMQAGDEVTVTPLMWSL